MPAVGSSLRSLQRRCHSAKFSLIISNGACHAPVYIHRGNYQRKLSDTPRPSKYSLRALSRSASLGAVLYFVCHFFRCRKFCYHGVITAKVTIFSHVMCIFPKSKTRWNIVSDYHIKLLKFLRFMVSFSIIMIIATKQPKLTDMLFFTKHFDDILGARLLYIGYSFYIMYRFII